MPRRKFAVTCGMMGAAKKGTNRTAGMSASHKEALAKGRADGLVVRAYLEALAATRPRPGRRRTTQTIKRRLESIQKELAAAGPLGQLHLLQEQQDLQGELAKADRSIDLTGLEDRFVKVAKAYGTRKGIEYATWRDVGVAAGVLERAGITRALPKPKRLLP